MIPPQIFSAIPAAINHLLADEEWARAKLRSHAGKVARFDAGFQRVALQITADGMVALAPQDGEAHVTIKVKAADLPLILQDRSKAFSYVTIEGDADFANGISQVSQGLRWDAEDDLSKLFGDIAASRMVAGAKSGMQTIRTTHQKLAENVAEYLLEEKPVLVRPGMVDEFGADVARLRDDVERLQKRLEKLASRVEGQRQ